MDAIRVTHVTKQYPNGVLALKGLSLSVQTGEIFSLLGQNGAGKSTLIRILTTYLRPTSGEVTVLGRDVVREGAAVRSRIACAAQQVSLDSHLSLAENMRFQARLYRIPKEEGKRRMEELISAFGLEEFRNRPAAACSGGVKRRLDIALAILSHPGILFLDEPSAGMDVRSRLTMWEMLKQIRKEFGTTILLTTHDLEEAGCLSDTVCIIKDGKETAQGSPEALKSVLRRDMVCVQFSSGDEARRYLPLFLEEFPQNKPFVRDREIFWNAAGGDGGIGPAAAFLLRQRLPFVGVRIARPSMEDVFLRLTQEEMREEETTWTR